MNSFFIIYRLVSYLHSELCPLNILKILLHIQVFCITVFLWYSHIDYEAVTCKLIHQYESEINPVHIWFCLSALGHHNKLGDLSIMQKWTCTEQSFITPVFTPRTRIIYIRLVFVYLMTLCQLCMLYNFKWEGDYEWWICERCGRNVVACFKLLSKHLHVGTHRMPQSRCPVSGLGFELRTS
jgi:hypothetical protein